MAPWPSASLREKKITLHQNGHVIVSKLLPEMIILLLSYTKVLLDNCARLAMHVI